MGAWDWLGDRLAIDAANTVRRRRDRYVDLLGSSADLLEWATRVRDRLPGPVPETADEAELQRFVALRDHLLAVMRAHVHGETLPEGSIAAINEIALRRPTVRLLAAGAGPGRERLFAATGTIDDLTAAVAADTVELMTGPDRDRLAICDAPSCGQVFLRARPNQQWCGPGCGNRARAARHHRRRRAAD